MSTIHVRTPDFDPGLTADMIVEAAAKHGHRFTYRGNGSWFDREDGCGCAAGMGAIAVDPNAALLNYGYPRSQDLIPIIGESAFYGLNDGYEGFSANAAENGRTVNADVYNKYHAIGCAVADRVERERLYVEE